MVYSPAAGSMILTDAGWQEVKLGRVFLASAEVESEMAERGGRIEGSVYAAHLGSAVHFQPQLSPLLKVFQEPGWTHVFLSDGPLWVRGMMDLYHPTVHLIVDYYHAMGYVAKAVEAGIGPSWPRKCWLESQVKLLKDSVLGHVMANIKALPMDEGVRTSVLTGVVGKWMVGSGA